MLATIIDRLGDLMNAVVLTSGGQKLDIPRVERPVTELQAARERDAAERSRAFIRRMVSQE